MKTFPLHNLHNPQYVVEVVDSTEGLFTVSKKEIADWAIDSYGESCDCFCIGNPGDMEYLLNEAIYEDNNEKKEYEFCNRIYTWDFKFVEMQPKLAVFKIIMHDDVIDKREDYQDVRTAELRATYL